MQDDEIVVSEVHVDSDNIVKNDNDPLLDLMPEALRRRLQVTQSRLPVKWDVDIKVVDPGHLTLDEDGDLELSRAGRSTQVLLDHCPATTLPTVGLQVWKAALVMSDFLLYRGRELLQGKGVVELGSGVGLCGIVAAAFADYVFCTDAWDEVLHLCQRNLDQNEDFYDALDMRQCPTRVRCLDWTKGLPQMQTPEGAFAWSAEDSDDFEKAGIFLAADVVYDDRLTDCLFELLLKTVTRGNQTVYISLEKRVNFTLEDLDAASPSHIHFVQWLKKLQELGWKVRIVNLLSVPQYFGSYSRDSYLELWELRPR
ncbi:methyltransferase-like protein 22 isoform X1 [Dermacentor variabilis]|uniref:methyltransferase-like protein 22 isoform X1 n=1 Tax=Dermacentor variabilis TaxID=34621 RepID=UPI003F5C3D05